MRSAVSALFSLVVLTSAYAQTTGGGAGTAGGTGPAGGGGAGAGASSGLATYWWLIPVVLVIAVAIWMLSRRRRTL